ncbi:MAG: 50S ribosomal protein L11 methyltransferase [Bacteroidales bacterium]|nr:50S ribosomal protein L11 methyltransferase [Bacteroidales bacterium]
MSYIEVSMQITPFTEESAEIVMATVEELGFESFTIEEPFLKGYIKKEDFSAHHLKCMLSFFDETSGFKVDWSTTLVQDENWNKVWESNFEPIVIDGECTIKASFHKDLPLTRYNITIEPRMAFGTGHHQTTELMVKWLFKIGEWRAAQTGAKEKHLRGLQVLDMGTGTGILAILAAKMGAVRAVHAIDVDIAAVNSAKENVWKNRMHRATTILYGDASLIQASKYDLILANINRNILLDDMATYARGLRSTEEVSFSRRVKSRRKSADIALASSEGGNETLSVAAIDDPSNFTGGLLVVSGFYTEDIPMLRAEAEKQGLRYIAEITKDGWAAVCFGK